MKTIINYFKKPVDLWFHLTASLITAIIYGFIIWFMFTVSGCSSFEKTTHYQPNTDWKIRKL